MNLTVLAVSYDSGHYAVRMGRGPRHLIDAGLVGTLEEDGHGVRVEEIRSSVEPATDVAVAFDLARSIAAAVRRALDAGRLPLVLAGNCFSAIGTVAGLGDGTSVLWLDAHGDLNTPDTSISGFLDGMAAATLTGRCWRELAATVPGFQPVPDYRFGLVGARDLDPAETALVATLAIPRVGADAFRRFGAGTALAPVLAATGTGALRYYLHIDLDVLDPEAARANQFAADGGLTVDDVAATIRAAADAVGIGAAAITAFDPAFDPDGRATRAAIEIARVVAGGAPVRSGTSNRSRARTRRR